MTQYIDKKETKASSVSPSKQKLEYKTKNITPQCKIVCYFWKHFGDDIEFTDDQLAQSTRLDISSQVINCTFSKTMGKPSGSFKFTLSNSPGIGKGDWKDIIKRGSWCVIYMSTDNDLILNPEVGAPNNNLRAEAPKIRCVGFIDRIVVQSSLDPRGAFDVVYEVTGRDFGVIYEDTFIWHNVFLTEGAFLTSVASAGLNVVGKLKLDKVLDIMHDIFFYPNNIDNISLLRREKKSLLEVSLQWLLPQKLVTDLGFSFQKDIFWGALSTVKNFSPTVANTSVSNPTDFLTGNAWSALKQISTPELHELYTETTDKGSPQLIFRPIPFATDKSKYKNAGANITLYKDLEPLVTIPAIDVIDFSIGEDNHNRYNSFLTTIDTTVLHTEAMNQYLTGSKFPFHIQNSIKRFGFRPMHPTVHSLVKTGEFGGQGDDVLIREFNHVMEDYWRPAFFSETGFVNIIGNNQVKIGKPLVFEADTPYVSGKRYYIEGYVDSFTIGTNGSRTWETSIYLTRGFVITDLEKKSFSNKRKDQFLREGEFTPSGSGEW